MRRKCKDSEWFYLIKAFDQLLNFLSKEIELIKDNEITSIEDRELNRTTKLIEKLSIQNEYKLNLLKEFSTYISNKK